MFRLVIFDLDGTLFSSENVILESLNRAFNEINLGPYDWESDIVRFFGKPFRIWAETLLREAGRYTPGLAERITQKAWDNYALLGPSMVRLNPGAKETLEKLKSKGVKLAVASNMMTRHAHILLPHFGIQNYFDKICTADSVKRPKPFPDQFDCIMESVKADKKETLMVGDTASDVDFARNCGIKVALLDASWNRSLAPDYRIKNLSKVLELK
ncbi:MAG: HAD family hydrolase [Candidatus Aenigmarchaeota archaeon]|nr:HAD family hydrolase [Candidatus Aenigmarchaeota archaeon]